MKTKLVLLFIIVSANTFSQTVFPESDAIWNIKIDGKEHYYGLSGDTVIGSLQYSKLYLLNDTTLTIDLQDKYVGGFRQAGEKVWFCPSLPADFQSEYLPYPQETLLYDFSKNEGDTIWHAIILNRYIYYWTVKDSIAASIVSFIDEQNDQKTYYTTQYVIERDGKFNRSGRDDLWKKGPGSMQGLFWFLSLMSVSGTPKFQLICFKQNDEINYLDSECTACFQWSSAGISKKNSIRLEVVQENTFIKIKGENVLFPCQLKVFNLMGQSIIEKIVYSSNENVSINHSGLALYRIEKENEVIKTGTIIFK